MAFILNPGKVAKELADDNNWLFLNVYDPNLGFWEASFETNDEVRTEIAKAYGRSMNGAATTTIELARIFVGKEE